MWFTSACSGELDARLTPGPTVQLSLLLSVPHMAAPMRITHALPFNLNAAGTSFGDASSPSVDLLRNPVHAKKVMVRTGVAFGARIGALALDHLQL